MLKRQAGMREDVTLWMELRRLRHPGHGRNLWEDDRQQARGFEQPDPVRAPRREEQPQ